ncbi:MAG: hypothetical protein E6J34_06985 [Chloroflexi bacterium]|nr:MAG: hypothetical protein E6J34_06985 [Chloroflexota bacterium]
MKNTSQPFMGEYHERAVPSVGAELSCTQTTHEQTQLALLLEANFSRDEATKLLVLRENLHENSEMRQRMENDYRMHFVRWLYEHGELSDFSLAKNQ